MQPFQLSGPGFLVFFGSAVAFVFLLALASELLRRPEKPLSDAELEALGPYEVARLAGGRDTAADAAVVSLVHAGYVALDEKGNIRRAADPGSRVGPNAYRSIAPDLLPIERAVFRAIADRPRSIHAVRASARGRAGALEEGLVRRGLMLAPLQRAFGDALGTCWPGAALWFVGVMRILRGVSDGFYVGFLVLMMVPLTVFVLKRRRRFPRATHRGDAALQQLRHQNAALETTAKSEPAQVDARELALAYGLFGTTVLTGDLLPLAKVFLFGRLSAGALTDAPSPIIEASGGFSCAAVGGGCGSSCSAGCGGCGGCGS